jgi:ribosomal protein S18 acetylase RimI-like enzyme
VSERPHLPPPDDAVDAPLRAVLPEGWSARPLAGEDGSVPAGTIEAALTVALRCEELCGIESETTRGEIAMLADGPESDPAGARLVVDPEGSPAAVCLIEVDPEAHRVFADVYADASLDGFPEGLWTAVARSGVARAEQVAAALGGDWRVESGSYAQDEAYHAVLKEVGLSPRRRFYRMRVDLADVAPDEPVAPSGVTLEVPRTDGQLRETWTVAQESFRHHWGMTAYTFESWLEYLRAMPGHDPQQWTLARVDGVAAAVCLCDDSRDEINEGYVRMLGVLEAYRGRGLARFLLQRSFRDATSRGRVGVQLGVDASNETGATQLYESVGMRPVRVLEAWQAELPLT